jgi:2-polyprenyl-3-methyl-5-hydroxy-6-metoxy-1,4-benzoquinol methylase
VNQIDLEKEKAKCFICNESDIQFIFELKDYPAYIIPVPTHLSKNVARGNLGLYCCHTCGHMQTITPDPRLQELIYEEYYSYYTVDSSESFRPPYRIPFTNFCDQLKADGIFENKINILEIGCSSGQQVDFLRGLAENYYGIDPSERIQLAIKDYPNDNFIQGYFHQDSLELAIDVMVSQFNLEHIENIQDFISTVYESLNSDGIIILQVPDIEDFRRNKQPNFMAHEHIQYFTRNSLGKLLESQGFEVVGWGEEGASLIVAARKTMKPTNFDFTVGTAIAVENGIKHKKLFLNSPSDIPDKVIYYGVGPQLYWLLEKNGGDIGDCVIFDDNPDYEKQGLPGFDNVIQKPSASVLQEYKYVVLSLNRFYHSKVLERLSNFNLDLKIFYIDESGVWNVITQTKSD